MDEIVCTSCGGALPAGFKFCGHCGVPLAGTPASQRDEFRDVTVLFADVSGFTAMSERLDPEAVHEIMNACFDGLGRIVDEAGGHIDKYIGDSLMALFGAPVAHDDDPQRAAEAALDMQAFLETFARDHAAAAGAEFRMRIGLHCGRVLAGGVGAEVRRDYSVMGDTVNTAARLEQAARPGTILVSEVLARRIGRDFRLGPRITFAAKGKAKPVPAHELLGEKVPGETAPHGTLKAPLIGRQDELRALHRLWTSGAPVIEIRGPMGIGKTRLAEAAAALEPSLTVIRAVSRASTANRPYALARRILHAAWRSFSATDELPLDRKAFEAAFHDLGPGLEPYWSALWYLAAPDALGVAPPDPDPMTFRRTLDRGIAFWLEALKAARPLAVLFLDAIDQADTASRDLLGRLVAEGRRLPLLVTTRRPDEAASGGAEAAIELTPLRPEAAAELLSALVGGAELPERLVSGLLERAAGIPLYIEELVRELVARGTLVPGEGGEPWRAVADEVPVSLPGSLLGAMVARLDRLDAPRRNLVVQCAAQGVEFDAEAARATWVRRGGRAQMFDVCLADLARLDIVRRGPGRTGRWAFEQVIMQNACYDQLLKRDRKSLHADIAGALVETSGRGAEGVSAEILAHHYELAELWREAAASNLRAGQRAAGFYANADARGRYSRALDALDALASRDPEALRMRIETHRDAADVELRVGNYAEAERHAAAIKSLNAEGAACAEADRLTAACRLHLGDLAAAEVLLAGALATLDQHKCIASERAVRLDLAEVLHRRGQLAEALTEISACRRLAGGVEGGLVRLDILEGRIAHTQGRFLDAVDLYRRAFETARGRGSLSEQALAANNMGNAARDVGHYGEAQEYFERALETWERTGSTESIAGVHNNLANLGMSRGDAALARLHFERSLNAFTEIGNVAGTALALTNLAILAMETGAHDDAVERAARARERLEGTGNRVLLGLTTVVLGEALLELGSASHAGREFERVLAEFEEANHALAVAGALRGRGRLALKNANADAAGAALSASLAIYERLAREQEAARTQVHLARAHYLAGRIADAEANLEQARARFKAIGAERDYERAMALRFERVA